MKQKQVLTVGRLVDMLNIQTKDNPSIREAAIVVTVSERGFPGTPCVTIEEAGIGFDWDSGKFMLYTSEPLVKKGKK